MRVRRREVAIPLLLAAGSYALAFVQRPGLATADTKINLHVDPGAYLGQVAHMWTATGQLGDVQAAQQVGYLFPMGPFFALGHALGLSAWVTQRLWLGTLLAMSAVGVATLLRVLRPGSRPVALLVAGAAAVLNPFVVTYANRTTVPLLASAALPWLLLTGLLVMMAGYPAATPLRHGLTFTYNRVAAVRFLRASYKAAPLVATAYAVLLGVGAQAVWRGAARRLSGAGPWIPAVARAGLVAGLTALLALAAWP